MQHWALSALYNGVPNTGSHFMLHTNDTSAL